MDTTTSSNRMLMVVTAGLATLLAAVVVMAVTSEPDRFDPATPEGVAQRYVEAILADDIDGATSFFTAELRRNCATDLRLQRRPTGRITVLETTVRDDSATVRLRFTTTSGDDPFQLSSWSYERDIDLRRVANRWLISATEWPWYSCREERPSP